MGKWPAALAAVLLIACGEQAEEVSIAPGMDPDDPYYCHPDTIARWTEWAEASDEGLWEGDPSHSVRFTWVQSYGGDQDMDPPFYSVWEGAISGDSLFIADYSGCRVVCMGVDGGVLWTRGEQGEGPGHFGSLCNVAVSDRFVLAADGMLDKVEVLDRSGQLLQLVPVSNPTDVVFVNDSTFAVLSAIEAGGEVHVYDCYGEKLSSFGEADWFSQPREVLFRMQDSYNALMAPDSVLLVSRWDTYHLYPFRLDDGTVGEDLARVYPTGVKEPQFRAQGNRVSGAFFRNMGKLFTGPEGMLNVELGNFAVNGNVLGGPDSVSAPVRLIDRYDWDWNYLDTYCLPMDGEVVAYSPEYGMFAHDYATGELVRFLVETGEP